MLISFVWHDFLFSILSARERERGRERVGGREEGKRDRESTYPVMSYG